MVRHTDYIKPVLRVLFTAALAMSTSTSVGSAASLTFVPPGAQLDGDPIADIETEVGQEIAFSVLLDTSGLGSSGSLDIIYNFSWDYGGEWGDGLVDLDVDFGDGGGACNLLNTCSMYYADLPLDRQGTLSVITFDVSPGLINDGSNDFSIQVVSATIGGVDVIGQFSPASQEVEVQPVPEPALVGTCFLGSLGVWFAYCRKRNFAGGKPLDSTRHSEAVHGGTSRDIEMRSVPSIRTERRRQAIESVFAEVAKVDYTVF